MKLEDLKIIEAQGHFHDMNRKFTLTELGKAIEL